MAPMTMPSETMFKPLAGVIGGPSRKYAIRSLRGEMVQVAAPKVRVCSAAK
jgi:hypothetical protein